MRHSGSGTAYGVALLRAVERRQPADRRICDDALAERLLNRRLVSVCSAVLQTGLYGWLMPGLVEAIAVRERAIDDVLLARVQEGVRQVVILGAGLDTRAYRLAELGPTTVFEVDHPASQADKRRRLRAAQIDSPTNLRFVAVDFETDDLTEQLDRHGYDVGARTVFVWQGVTPYLRPGAVDRTLVTITRHAAPGSVVVFDYCDPAAIQRYRRRLRATTSPSGEPFVFGIRPEDIVDFLSLRGFDDIVNLTPADLEARYLTGPNRSRRIMPLGCIVSARVAGSPGVAHG